MTAEEAEEFKGPVLVVLLSPRQRHTITSSVKPWRTPPHDARQNLGRWENNTTPGESIIRVLYMREIHAQWHLWWHNKGGYGREEQIRQTWRVWHWKLFCFTTQDSRWPSWWRWLIHDVCVMFHKKAVNVTLEREKERERKKSLASLQRAGTFARGIISCRMWMWMYAWSCLNPLW